MMIIYLVSRVSITINPSSNSRDDTMTDYYCKDRGICSHVIVLHLFFCLSFHVQTAESRRQKPICTIIDVYLAGTFFTVATRSDRPARPLKDGVALTQHVDSSPWQDRLPAVLSHWCHRPLPLQVLDKTCSAVGSLLEGAVSEHDV